MKSMKPEERIFPSYRTVVVLAVILLAALLICVPFLVAIAFAEEPAQPANISMDASPIFDVTVHPATDNGSRSLVGNQTAIDAYNDGKLPFPDGTILVKRAWTRTKSPGFASATIPGTATIVQVMVKLASLEFSPGDGQAASRKAFIFLVS